MVQGKWVRNGNLGLKVLTLIADNISARFSDFVVEMHWSNIQNAMIESLTHLTHEATCITIGEVELWDVCRKQEIAMVNVLEGSVE